MTPQSNNKELSPMFDIPEPQFEKYLEARDNLHKHGMDYLAEKRVAFASALRAAHLLSLRQAVEEERENILWLFHCKMGSTIDQFKEEIRTRSTPKEENTR